MIDILISVSDLFILRCPQFLELLLSGIQQGHIKINESYYCIGNKNDDKDRSVGKCHTSISFVITALYPSPLIRLITYPAFSSLVLERSI